MLQKGGIKENSKASFRYFDSVLLLISLNPFCSISAGKENLPVILGVWPIGYRNSVMWKIFADATRRAVAGWNVQIWEGNVRVYGVDLNFRRVFQGHVLECDTQSMCRIEAIECDLPRVRGCEHFAA